MPIAIFRDRDGAAEIIGLECPHKLSPIGLPNIPPFIRFNNVNVTIWCNFPDHPIKKKCEFIENQLLPLKLALNDSNVVEFIATISQNDRNNFSDHLKLLNFIRNCFLPICNSSRRYKFQIWFRSDANSDTNVIASILEMDEIKRCSNVKIGIIYGEQTRLPVEEISNWLQQSADGAKNNHQNQKERFLKIWYQGRSTFVQNAQEMLDHLKTAYLMADYLSLIFSFSFSTQR